MIPRNPLTMTGTIDRCWLFTYATPAREVAPLVPVPLTLIERDGCAWWNVVVTHVTDMRPRHAPRILGMSYWHVAYRLHVRANDVAGLYFVRSDCDRALMTLAGNLVTDFRFHTTPIRVVERGDEVAIDVGGSAPAHVVLSLSRRKAEGSAPPNATSLAHAGQIPPCGRDKLLPPPYAPYGISVGRDAAVNIVAISRDDTSWRESLVTVDEARWSFFDGRDVRAVAATEVAPIDYVWNRGRTLRTCASY